MNLLELFEKYPKTSIVAKQWFLQKMLDNINDANVPEDFKETVRGMEITEQTISDIVSPSPRSLFDLFDMHKVYIQINIYQLGASTEFSFSILGEDVKVVDTWDNRIDAERAAIEQAFVILNNKL